MPLNIYSEIIQNAPQANFIFDLGLGQFTHFNHAFTTFIGFEAKNSSIDPILTLIPSEDQNYLKKNFKKFLQGTTIQNLEFRLQTKGQEKWVSLSPFLYNSSSKNLIIGYMSDITAERHNIETIKKYANKKNSILNILSHDLRGPLGIANMMTQVLDKKIQDPELVKLTKTVSKIIKQSIDMIADLTGREFLESTDVELVRKRVNIAVKLQEYMEECQKSEEISNRTFEFTCSSDSIFLNVDESKFMQIFNNLMTNALKFTHNQGIISLTLEEQSDSVLFKFSDNGIGIPKQFHSMLFQKFSDARRKGLHGEPTVGLGLSIVKTIVEWHKGKIWFESKEGKGTTFYIEIPSD